MTDSKSDEARRLIAADGTLPWSYSWQMDTGEPPHGDVRDTGGGHVATVGDISSSELIVFAVNNIASLADENDALRADVARWANREGAACNYAIHVDSALLSRDQEIGALRAELQALREENAALREPCELLGRHVCGGGQSVETLYAESLAQEISLRAENDRLTLVAQNYRDRMAEHEPRELCDALRNELAEANRKLDLVLWECPECSFRFDKRHDHIDGTHSCPNCAEGALRDELAGKEAELTAADALIASNEARIAELKKRERELECEIDECGGRLAGQDGTIGSQIALIAELRLDLARLASIETAHAGLSMRCETLRSTLERDRRVLASTRDVLTETQDALRAAKSDLSAIAHAVGICHEADGHGCHPGPTSVIIEAIERLRATAAELQNRAGCDGR